MAILANSIVIGCHTNISVHQDPVYISALFNLYFGGLCTIDLVGLLILHVEPDFEIAFKGSPRAVSH